MTVDIIDGVALVEEIFGPCEKIAYRAGEFNREQRLAELGLQAQSLGVLCSACRYNEAVMYWRKGKPYCQACRDDKTA